ncbi:hypothetical protein RclHR1_00410003 [Rhizophagus clarus]|uniref:Protein kinase domain-containing protein n=1 Tax=Rhizophagus clarus TaxID=94130 RepID=A0A2Z6REV9_9GLOM|nr:hypothetical protein RclHR1_00410003 [Rhizophagus clarus]
MTSFTYISELLDDYTRTIWKAKTDDGHMIVVKFVSRYNALAHKLCENGGYAPKLLHCSDNNEIRFGRLKMIVMEYINGTSLDQILKDGTIDSLSHQARQAILDNVTAAIQLLHDNKFVFADLRPPNIMINETDQRAMLIDFDWCGIHDLERYPPSMNSKLPWPTGADPGTVLRKEHDTYWLDLLRKSLK